MTGVQDTEAQAIITQNNKTKIKKNVDTTFLCTEVNLALMYIKLPFFFSKLQYFAVHDIVYVHPSSQKFISAVHCDSYLHLCDFYLLVCRLDLKSTVFIPCIYCHLPVSCSWCEGKRLFHTKTFCLLYYYFFQKQKYNKPFTFMKQHCGVCVCVCLC